MDGRGTRAIAAAALRRAVLGLWLGSVACFAAVVAPTLFRVLQEAGADRRPPAPNALAGDVVVPVLQALAWWSLVCGVVALGLLRWDVERRHARWRVGGIALGLLSAVLSVTWLVPTMLDLLSQMGVPVDALARTHPLRARFDGLHAWTSSIHAGMVVGPLVALLCERDHSTR